MAERAAGLSHQTYRPQSEAERVATTEQLRRLQRVTDTALANLAVDDLLDELLIRTREALETDTAAILLIDDAHEFLEVKAAKGLEEEVEAKVRIPFGRGFAGTVAASGEAISIDDIDHSIVMNPILREKGVRSLLGVPLVAQGQTIGVLHVGTLRLHHFTAEQVMLLQLVGDRIALAIRAGLYERERAAARSLQRALLPEELPEFPGMRLAARYLPARGGEVGGDWYDVFVLPSGRLGVAIGDVVGRGLEAAAAMGRIRHELRAYAFEGSSPPEVLARLNRLQQLVPRDMATVLFGTIDPVTLGFEFASAGHLPPVIRHPGRAASASTAMPGPPLGAPEREYALCVEPLEPGSALVLYTDGLIERRRTPLDDGIARLCAAIEDGFGAETLCSEIVERVAVADAPDDVAVLVATADRTLGARFAFTISARPDQVRTARRILDRWLGERGVDLDTARDVVAASSEAVANAVEHAYGADGGTVRVLAADEADRVTVSVEDRGGWLPATNRLHRGRGLDLMRGLSQDVAVRRSPEGTTVVLTWRRP